MRKYATMLLDENSEQLAYELMASQGLEFPDCIGVFAALLDILSTTTITTLNGFDEETYEQRDANGWILSGMNYGNVYQQTLVSLKKVFEFDNLYLDVNLFTELENELYEITLKSYFKVKVDVPMNQWADIDRINYLDEKISKMLYTKQEMSIGCSSSRCTGEDIQQHFHFWLSNYANVLHNINDIAKL